MSFPLISIKYGKNRDSSPSALNDSNVRLTIFSIEINQKPPTKKICDNLRYLRELSDLGSWICDL